MNGVLVVNTCISTRYTPLYTHHTVIHISLHTTSPPYINPYIHPVYNDYYAYIVTAVPNTVWSHSCNQTHAAATLTIVAAVAAVVVVEAMLTIVAAEAAVVVVETVAKTLHLRCRTTRPTRVHPASRTPGWSD